MNISFSVPDANAPTIVESLCGLHGYVPPPGGNDTLGCDSLGNPTPAGLSFSTQQVVSFVQNVCVAWQARQVDAQALLQKQQIAAAVGSVSVGVTTSG